MIDGLKILLGQTTYHTPTSLGLHQITKTLQNNKDMADG
ncbi:hypothetical protein B488_08950 [Liberibacter crescens BT-1]|uniref:Uncharacterized protein n=1 Tax=Liberibacter crescens (strain BT-1) TaxID=1215343 RepID=L0EVA2_LIBCB|nr:hypothetical protein B488_08950 [Liberibacter crescens BT-1]